MKIELEEFHDQKPDALFVRSRFQKELHNEKCSALFHQRLKENKVKKDIKKITDENTSQSHLENQEIIVLGWATQISFASHKA